MRNYKYQYSTLIHLGLPIIIGQLGVIILGFADTLMVGHHSTEELAAASFVNNLFNLCIIFGTGFSYGLTPVVGSFFGSGKLHEAGRALRSSLLANTMISFLLIALMTILYFQLGNLEQPEELMVYIKPYYLVTLVSIFFVMGFNAFKQFTDGITETKISMWILLAGNALNIIGNYLLIYGKAGLPEMGLLGAGVSTLISRFLMMMTFAYILWILPRFREYRQGFVQSGWSRSLFKHLNALGWPVALQMGMETSSFSLSTIMVGWLGTTALAAHQIMLTISTFTFMMYYGMGAAVAIRISHFHSQQDHKQERMVAYSGFHLIFLMSLFLLLILFVFRHYIAPLFTDDAGVAATIPLLFLPFLIYQFGDGLQVNFSNALRGISVVKPVMWIALVAYFILAIPAGYFFGFILDWGLPGIWMAFPVGLTSAGFMFFLVFKKHTSTFRH